MKNIIKDFITKYLFTFIGIIALTVYNFIFFKDIDFINTNDTYGNIYLYFVDFILGSFIAYKVFTVYGDKFDKYDKIKKLGLKIVTIIFFFSFAVFLQNASFNLITTLGLEKDRYEILKPVYILIPILLILYLENKEKDISTSKYLLMLFRNFLLLHVFILIVIIGIMILIFIYSSLIGEVDFNTIGRIIISASSFISWTGMLLSFDKTEYSENMFLKVLVKYVMLSIVFVGFVIVYAFMVGIIINRELPKNQIYMVGIALFFIGILTSYMSLAFDGNNKLAKCLPILFIPVLIMQYIALFIRIINYSLTPYRYLALMVLIIETLFIIIYIFKNENVKNMFLYAAAIIFIVFYLPFFNAYSFPKTINNIFFKNVEQKKNSFSENKTIYYIYKNEKDEDIENKFIIGD